MDKLIKAQKDKLDSGMDKLIKADVKRDKKCDHAEKLAKKKMKRKK